MPAEGSPAILVARFLRTNNYHETLAAFLQEAGLPSDAGSSFSNAMTIEKILEEKRTFDLSVNLEKLGVAEKANGWTMPAPSRPTIVRLPTSANILQTSVEYVLPNKEASEAEALIFASTADRRLNVVLSDGFGLLSSHTQLQDSPILSYCTVRQRYLICASMSGKVVVFDSKRSETTSQRKDHSKYVVQVTCYEQENGLIWLATAGWDGRVLVYTGQLIGDHLKIEDPVGLIQLPSNPEAILFSRHPEDGALYLLVTRRDSTFIFYYKLAEETFSPPTSMPVPVPLYGKQNLAPNSNAWIAFTPAGMAPCPIDPTLIAVATSTVPHMKLLIVRLLFPNDEMRKFLESQAQENTNSSSTSLLDGSTSGVAQYARATLALQDREAASIHIQCNTMSPQTQYSTPALAWRPDGTGVWVNSDDGAIRGIEAATGKIVAKLEGHEVGSKIRCLWAGSTAVQSGRGNPDEWVISGGFDQRLIVWRT